MRITLLLLLITTLTAKAQLTAEEALQKVFDVLTAEEASVEGNAKQKLTIGAWEALSYLNEAEEYAIEDLQEAVPDYYHFLEEEVIIRLINQENYNEYGLELKLAYRINKGNIELLDKTSKNVKDTWHIIYLDKNYLALDMGDIRVFFTHTPDQE